MPAKTRSRAEAKKKAGAEAPMRTGTLRTRATIIAAATAVFAERGFDGAPMDEIAQRAGLPKNLLYYHFGDKDGLFTAVLEAMYETIRDRQEDLSIRHLDPVLGISQLVRFTGRVWLEYPEFMHLVHTENLQNARHIRASKRIARLYNPLLDTLRHVIALGQRAGSFRRKVDPTELYISITSLTAHYLSHHRTIDAVLGAGQMTPARVKRRLDHAVEMVLAWLAPPGLRRPERR